MREQSLEQIATSRRRWQSRLTRAVNAIKKLDAKEQRLKKRAAAPKAERRASPVRQVAAAVTPPSPLPPAPSADTLDIPGFLDRRSDRAKEADRKRLAELNDREAAAQIRAEQADVAKRKKAGQAAKRKAQRSGETRRMPLSGKAALDKILHG